MSVGRTVRRWLGREVPPVWYHPHYRLPLASAEHSLNLEPRRADLVAWYLDDAGVVPAASLHRPERISLRDLSRVHTPAYLASLSTAHGLAPIFGQDDHGLPVDEIMHTVRLACGGTVAAALQVFAQGGAALNLLGGFHHAAPDRGAGLCPVNDIAVAIAVLRSTGLKGAVTVLDLDAHPPDGTAECLRGDRNHWIGSISGSDWGPIDGVDETVLPAADDETFLAALDGLLDRMPPAEMAFVLAGGDVLATDKLGLLRLSEQGARERDRRVAAALRDTPSVWLPAGGYSPISWRVLAGTALVLAGRPGRKIPPDVDPMGLRFAAVSATLETGPEPGLTEDDIAEALGLGPKGPRRLLDYYSAEQIEFALHAVGILDHLRRLQYHHFRVAIDRTGTGDRFRLLAFSDDEEHLLVECVLDRSRAADRPVLFVNWLTLRHPAGAFTDERPRLPGQEVPGLGLAQEAGRLLRQVAERLDLHGVAFRPAWYHTAYAARKQFRFADPARQGRFEALVRDLGDAPLLAITTALAEGRVRMNGEPYAWEADDMVFWLDGSPYPDPAAFEERDRVSFTLD